MVVLVNTPGNGVNSAQWSFFQGISGSGPTRPLQNALKGAGIPLLIINDMKDYIFFKPPDEVANIKAKLWNTKQAKVYFDWFISVKDDRVEYLLTSIDETLTGNHKIDIRRIGKKVSPLSVEFQYAAKGLCAVRTSPTSDGYAYKTIKPSPALYWLGWIFNRFAC